MSESFGKLVSESNYPQIDSDTNYLARWLSSKAFIRAFHSVQS